MPRSFRLLAVLLVSAGAVHSENASPIDGRWKVVLVEVAGAIVPGLKDAELFLADRKKIFILPDGTIEVRTYKLDTSKKPAEIDSTTTDKVGTEKGIYTLDGDTLKLCLAP